MKFICGILNSNLFTFWAQNLNVIRYSKGKQPQIKVSDLYKIPVIQNDEIKKEIIYNVNCLYKTKDNKKYAEQIDRLIYKYYQINENEIKYIETKIIDF